MGVRMAFSNMHRIDWLADRFLPPDDSPRPNDRRREQMFLIAHFASPIGVAILAVMLYVLAGWIRRHSSPSRSASPLSTFIRSC